jgi:hypothetical protein
MVEMVGFVNFPKCKQKVKKAGNLWKAGMLETLERKVK